MKEKIVKKKKNFSKLEKYLISQIPFKTLNKINEQNIINNKNNLEIER